MNGHKLIYVLVENGASGGSKGTDTGTQTQGYLHGDTGSASIYIKKYCHIIKTKMITTEDT